MLETSKATKTTVVAAGIWVGAKAVLLWSKPHAARTRLA